MISREPPERDYYNNNFKVDETSENESELSDRVCEQILGGPCRRSKKKPTNLLVNQKIVGSNHTQSRNTIDNNVNQLSDPSVHFSEEGRKSIVELPQNPQRSSSKFFGTKFATIHTQTSDIETNTVATETNNMHSLEYCEFRDKCTMKNCSCGQTPKQQCCNFCNDPHDSVFLTPGLSSAESAPEPANQYRNLPNPRRWEDTSESEQSVEPVLELPYQYNDDYSELLDELEEKLIDRNKARVRRTMLEFERRSRMNQNLDKPIFDDDEIDEKPILQKLTGLKLNDGKCKCLCCRRRRKRRPKSEFEEWSETSQAQSNYVPLPSPPPLPNCRPIRKSHWKLDCRTGEWVKIKNISPRSHQLPQKQFQCYGDFDQNHLSNQPNCRNLCQRQYFC